jgi:hypothetical protein
MLGPVPMVEERLEVLHRSTGQSPKSRWRLAFTTEVLGSCAQSSHVCVPALVCTHPPTGEPHACPS